MYTVFYYQTFFNQGYTIQLENKYIRKTTLHEKIS